MKSPFTVLHFSLSSWVKACISYRPSQHNQFFITWAFSCSESSYALVSRILDIFVSKFMSARYLSCVYQFNANFTSTGPLCFLSLWLPMTQCCGQPGSFLHISRCHHSCHCCLYGHLIHYFIDIIWFCHILYVLLYVLSPTSDYLNESPDAMLCYWPKMQEHKWTWSITMANWRCPWAR